MASLRKFVGKIPFKRATAFLGTRYGRGIKAQAVSEAGKERIEYRKLIKHSGAELSRTFAKEKRKTVLKSLQGQVQILQKLRKLERPLHVTEFLASMAFEVGLKKENLQPIISTASTLQINSKREHGQALLRGSFTTIRNAVKLDLLKKIADLLEQTRGQALPTQAIGAAVYPEFSTLKGKVRDQALIDITQALGVLELMRIASKQPSISKTHQFAWTNYSSRYNAPKPRYNTGYQILERLSNGPKTREDLAKELGITAHTITRWADNLCRVNMIQLKKAPGVGKHELRIELTSNGKRLLAEQEVRGTITPEMRLALLGEKTEQLKYSEITERNRIIRWLKVWSALQSGKTRKSVIENLKEDPTYVAEVAYRGTKPWGGKPTAKFFARMIQLVNQRDPELGREFMQYCLDHKLIEAKNEARK